MDERWNYMEKYKLSPAMRSFFFFAGSIIWLGIWLTGFSIVHWLLFVPASVFAFAAVTGICPGMIVLKALFRDNRP